LVDLPDWKSKTALTIAVGQLPRVTLLRRPRQAKYRVELVLREPLAAVPLK